MSAHQSIEAVAPVAMPFWPRLLSADLAATYLGISRANLLARVTKHMLPQPRKIGARVLWDRTLLDQYADALFGIVPANDQEEPPADEKW